jgi:hypothetical protein
MTARARRARASVSYIQSRKDCRAPPMDSCTFLPPAAAAVEIVDESVEPYISLLGAGEVHFMTGEALPPACASAAYGDPAVAAEATRRWSAAVRAWTADEEAGVRYMVGLVNGALRGALGGGGGLLPMLEKLGWRFIKVRAGFCGGMSHTRGRCVVFAEGVTAIFATAADTDAPMRARLASLLAHEQLHGLGRPGAVKRPSRFPMKINFVWGFCVGTLLGA